MEAARLQDYIAGYDRRRAARMAARQQLAARARAAVPAIAQLCRAYGARRVRLFGSLVTGLLGTDPDIDLAVEGVPPQRFFELWGRIATLQPAGVEVDLVDLARCTAALRRAIEQQGVDV
ncbi:MAG: hypothetical protein KatS3mg102_1539 [Planctomycetota bacterium]|nr:MAG: hypothetical protein KatS3mg102_1539 [Planctomycetota bacterium]